MPDNSSLLNQQYNKLNHLTGNLIRGNFSSNPEYKPDPVFNSFSVSSAGAFIYAPAQFQTDPGMYDMDKVAAQGTFKDMWNSFFRGINETQKGIGQNDYYFAAKRIAEIEGGLNTSGELQALETAYQAKQIKEAEYLNKKSKLISELQTAYSDLGKAKMSILEDEEDILKYPVKKSYQLKEQYVQSVGNDADFLDQIIYTTPTTAGSSAATLGATFTSQIVGSLAKKAIAQTAATWLAGPQVGAIATAGGIVVSMAELLFARSLESKAEVGGQIDQDFQELKDRYLKQTGKESSELTKEEINDLILQASRGAEGMMKKNMSLAAMDAVQSSILWGVNKVLPTGLSKVLNSTKRARVASTLGGLYTGAKLESLEEGLQFAFGSRKSADSLGGVENQESYYNKGFMSQLATDWGDVLSSLDFGIFKGNGRYSQNKEFQFATESGFILGALMGGSGAVFRTASDIYNYRQANKALKDLGILDTEGKVNKIEAEAIASFLNPRTKGSPRGSFINADIEDRYHYLRTAIRGLAKSVDEAGNPLLPREAAKDILSKIDSAYEKTVKVDKHLNNIVEGWGKDSKKMQLFKEILRMNLYTSLFQLDERKNDFTEALNKHAEAMAKSGNNPNIILTDLKNKIEILEETLKHPKANENFKAQAAPLLEQYKKQFEELKSLTGDQELLEPSIDLVEANRNLIANTLFKNATEKKVNDLLKIKSKKALYDYFKDFKPEEAEKEQTEEETDYAGTHEARKSKKFTDLTPEEKEARKKENEKLAKEFEIPEASLTSLSEQELDDLINEELDTYLKDNATYDDKGSEIATANLKSVEELTALLAKSKKYKKWFKANFNIPDLNNITLVEFNAIVAKSKAAAEKRRFSGKGNKIKKTIEDFKDIKLAKSTLRTKAVEDERSKEQLEKEFGVKDGKASALTVLNAIINSKFATDEEKLFAGELLKLVKPDDTITFQENKDNNHYDINTDTIIIDLRYVADDYVNYNWAVEAAILHEYAHKITHNEINKKPELKKELEALYAEVLKEAQKQGVDAYYYGFTNEDEMLAEAFSNPDFREKLSKIKLSEEYMKKYGNQKSILKALTNFITAVLKSLGITLNDDALSQVLGFTERIFDGRVESEDQMTARAIAEGKRLLDEFDKSVPEDLPLPQKMDRLFKSLYGIRNNPVILSYLKTPDQYKEFNSALEAYVTALGDKWILQSMTVFGKHNLKKGLFIIIFDPASKKYITAKVLGLALSDNQADQLRVEVDGDNNKKVIKRVANPDSIDDYYFEKEEEAKERAKQLQTELDEQEEDQGGDGGGPGGAGSASGKDFYEFRPGSALKTINQPLVDGKENENPLYKLYQKVLDFLSNLPDVIGVDGTIRQENFPYAAVMVLDGLEPVLFPDGNYYNIPHDPITLENAEKGKVKWAPVLVLTDKSGKPVFFDQTGKPTEDTQSGSLVVMNMETDKKIDERLNNVEDLKSIARFMMFYIEGAESPVPDIQKAKAFLKSKKEELKNLREQIKPGVVSIVILDRISAGFLQSTDQPNDTLQNLQIDELVLDTVQVAYSEKSPLGPLLSHPEFQGLVGRDYIILDNTPIRLHPKKLLTEDVDYLLEVLDFADKQTEEVKDAIYTEIRKVYFIPKGTAFAGGAIIIGEGGSKKSFRGEDRRAYLETLRYNMQPQLANQTVKKIIISNGYPIIETVNYNDHIKRHFQTRAVVSPDGKLSSINKYFGYTPQGAVTLSEPKKQEAKKSNPPSDLEAKKADIERRRQEALRAYDERDLRSLESFMPDNPNHPTFKVGMKYDKGMNVIVEQALNADDYDGREDAYPAITKIISPAEFGADGKMTKAAKIEVTLFNTKEDADRAIKERYERVKSKAGQKQKEINAKYDAELAALNQDSTESSTKNEPLVKQSDKEIKKQVKTLEKERDKKISTLQKERNELLKLIEELRKKDDPEQSSEALKKVTASVVSDILEGSVPNIVTSEESAVVKEVAEANGASNSADFVVAQLTKPTGTKLKGDVKKVSAFKKILAKILKFLAIVGIIISTANPISDFLARNNIVSREKTQFVLDLSRTPSKLTENSFNKEQLAFIHQLIKKAESRGQSYVTYNEYPSGDAGIRRKGDESDKFINLTPEQVVKKTIGKFRFTKLENGNYLVIDQYNFNDSKVLTKTQRWGRLLNSLVDSDFNFYAKLRDIAGVFGSEEGEGALVRVQISKNENAPIKQSGFGGLVGLALLSTLRKRRKNGVFLTNDELNELTERIKAIDSEIASIKNEYQQKIDQVLSGKPLEITKPTVEVTPTPISVVEDSRSEKEIIQSELSKLEEQEKKLSNLLEDATKTIQTVRDRMAQDRKKGKKRPAKSKPAAISKAQYAKNLYKKVGDIDIPRDAYGIVLQVAAGGLKIGKEAYGREVVRRRPDDIDASSNELVDPKKTKTLKKEAHEVWENIPEEWRDQITDKDISDAFIEVYGSFDSRIRAAEMFLEMYSITEPEDLDTTGSLEDSDLDTYISRQYIEEEKRRYDEEMERLAEISRAELEWFEALNEEESELKASESYVESLIEQYKEELNAPENKTAVVKIIDDTLAEASAPTVAAVLEIYQDNKDNEQQTTQEFIEAVIVAEETGLVKTTAKLKGSKNHLKLFKEFIRKIRKAIMSLGVIATLFLTNTSLIIPKSANVTVTQASQIDISSTDAAINSISEVNSVLYPGQSYIIVDKNTKEAIVFDSTNKEIFRGPAIIGKTQDSDTLVQKNQQTYKDFTESDRVTPAGVFKVKRFVDNAYDGGYTYDLVGGRVGRFAVSFHAVVETKERLDALASPTPDDNYQSFGCISISKENMHKINPSMTSTATIYIIPEITNRELFKTYLQDRLSGSTKSFTEKVRAQSLSKLKAEAQEVDFSHITKHISEKLRSNRKNKRLNNADLFMLVDMVDQLTEKLQEIKQKRVELQEKLRILDSGESTKPVVTVSNATEEMVNFLKKDKLQLSIQVVENLDNQIDRLIGDKTLNKNCN